MAVTDRSGHILGFRRVGRIGQYEVAQLRLQGRPVFCVGLHGELSAVAIDTPRGGILRLRSR